jgi:glucose 1-dehydrogenase
MKAMAVRPGEQGSARVVDRPDPSEDEGSVLVEGLRIGICGTDMELVESGAEHLPEGRDELVLGHESLGRVLEAPPGSGLSPGDHVMGVVRRPDPVPCECCAQGRWDWCRNGRFTERGINGADGYGAQRWRVDPIYAVPVPEELGMLGVLVEPTSVVAKAWELIEQVSGRGCTRRERALVAGAGPIGLLAALLARQRDLVVHVVDREEDGPKPGLVADLGATYHTSADDLPKGLEDGFDVVVDSTGSGALVVDLVDNCRPGAVLAVTGLSASREREPAALDRFNTQLVMGDMAVVGSVNAARHHYEDAVTALVAADASWLERLITRTVPLADWTDALKHRPDDVKVVVDLTDGG